MKNYQVPPNMEEKEKIVGGIFDIGQAAWLATGLVIGMGVFVTLRPVIGYGALFLAVPLGLSGIPFVFLKPKGLTLFNYLNRKRVFNKKTKVLQLNRQIKEW